jgi:hypothetical protein
MLTDTQISSFLVPATIWHQGLSGRPDLPPLALPARDALDIERRDTKGARLRNEARRYVLCCERIQGIVRELSMEVGVLSAPVVWPATSVADGSVPTARAYLALSEAIGRFVRGSPYPRICAIFFPPEHGRRYLHILDAILQEPQLDQLLSRAATAAALPGSTATVTSQECGNALQHRREMLTTVASQGCGLVDVVELI